jgi:hypothetical protein
MFAEGTLKERFALNGSGYDTVLKSALSPAGCLKPEQTLIIHFANWIAYGDAGPYSLIGSNWYVYHRARLPMGTCILIQATLKADDTARLYGDRSAILLGVDIFTPRSPSGSPSFLVSKSLPIVYKVYVTPEKAQNVQDLSNLASALLGLSPSPSGGGNLSRLEAAVPVTYVAIAAIDGFKRLPFDFNVGFSLQPSTVPIQGTVAGGPATFNLPNGRVGTPYSGNDPARRGALLSLPQGLPQATLFAPLATSRRKNEGVTSLV